LCLRNSNDGSGVKEYKMIIYNKWGIVLYESSSQDKGWDGKHNGDDQPAGVYMYIFTGITFNGTPVQLGGNVTLVR